MTPAPALTGALADVLLVTGFGLAAAAATAVVLTRDPVRQAIVFSGHGLVLGLLFVILQAPDVAMSQIGVGAVVVPLIVVLALHATRRHRPATDGDPDTESTESTDGTGGGAGEPGGRRADGGPR
ncbi:Na(+)/H(+) antiporter subunit B [Actinomadura sp. WAC 06369]|uniref:Na(+)/H(+) antiporter subunit B n=1 Tax=Actinomadura sp. WAC 06369 TaxID=2203193 RepID=UPI001F3C6336|nr:DUF4040 domain-containing protein [Actinomadura sp. WAC 06369]